MKNLKLLKKTVTNLDAKILSICLNNSFEEGLLCATNETISLSNESVSKVVSNAACNIEVLQSGSSIFCATQDCITSYDNSNGEIIDKIDFPLRILAFSLCPDESMLLVLTEDLMFSILSNELEILSEFSLEQGGFGSAEPLSVGWGKKETQFHGKSGKGVRDHKEKASDTSSFDSEKVYISWKDDGEYFAVSWNCQTQIQTDIAIGARLIRVFSKDGELFSTSEAINTLENGLFWRSKASLIATSCRSNKGLEIAFIEQNGLKHGGFMLFDKESSEQKVVSSIHFSPINDICAISIQDIKLKKTYVQLFNTNNYHWYLKQHILFDDIEVLHMVWANSKLHLCTSTGIHYAYSWYEEVDRSLIIDYNCSEDIMQKSPNIVSVIDGKNLLMTPFAHCVVPPPYCAFTIEFDDYVSYVSFPVLKHSADDLVSCFVQFCNGNCTWLKLKRDDESCVIDSIRTNIQRGRKAHQYVPISSVIIGCKDSVNKICWINNDSFYGVFGNNLYLCNLSGAVFDMQKMDHPGVEVANVCHADQVYIQDHTGSVYSLDTEMTFMFKYSYFCQEMLSVSLKSEQNCTLIGLSRRFNQLFINGHLQCGSYLSVLALKNHILFTNVNQKLRCISLLQNNLKDFMHMLDDANYNSKCDFDDTLRLIEPGAEIITCVPADSKIVLMMPRGNLETIYPRALILDDLKTSMESNLYSSSIEKMRKHRVNLNLVYDHNPCNFMANLEKMVHENRKNDRLVLLVSELSNENVTETMYKRFYDTPERELEVKVADRQEKVNRICGAILDMFSSGSVPEDYLYTTLISYVKMSPSRADKALQLLCVFKSAGDSKTWDKGLKYLQYLISIDELYRIAMSTYDLGLTLQVAQKTQLDPKEYVDFLNDLNELPCDNYRKYKINMFLKQYTLALEFVATVADRHWPEVVELVRGHDLYVRALQLFTVGTDHFNELSALFAEHLIAKTSNLKAAGMVYLRTGDKQLCDKAAHCFLRTLHWKEWCIAATKSGMTQEEVYKTLRHMAERLHDMGRHDDSMNVYEIYLDDVESALNVSLVAASFVDSFRLLCRLKSDEVVSSERVQRAIVASYGVCVQQLEDARSTFTSELDRLGRVRTDFVKHYNDMKNIGEDEALPDYMSDTTSDASSLRSCSSTGSRQSNYSQQSHKSRKKATKKLWTDKAGSQKEEIAVMEKLTASIRSAQTMIDDVRGLADVLSYVNKIDESARLVTLMNRLLADQSAALTVIWDRFVFDPSYELNESEYPISNHIRVSRGPKYAGRRRYMIDEEFLRHAPEMKIRSVSNDIAGCN